MQRSLGALRAALLGMAVFFWGGLPVAAAEPFPQFDAIAPNVAFWTDVYSRYPTTQVIIHDSIDLNIVYDVITVKPYDMPGAPRINRSRTKRAIATYRDILKRLAANPHIKDKDCQRVAKLFGPNANAKTFLRASQRVRGQLGQKDRFRAGLIRSGAYLDEIRTILTSYGVPEDLAYLPHVESSFNPSAYSKFGAAGIWQFTRSTGKRFMKVDYVLDERRDPIRATHAAAQLLRENYEKLGSWPLAITAYNHGAAGMARARQKHGDYPAIFTAYRSRTFKFASRNFYSEFLAARQVASDHTAYFGSLDLAAPAESHTVRLDGYVRFEDLCAHYKVASDIMKQMNPALRSPVFNDQKYVPKGYELRLPLDAAPSGATLAAIPSALYQSAQKPSRFYTVQRGDTAGRIARVHGVRLSDLILANNLSARATIYPRQTLRIPVPGEKIAPPKTEPLVVVAAEPPIVVAAIDKAKVETPEPSGDLGVNTTQPEPETAKPEPGPGPVALAPVPASGKTQEPQATTTPSPEEVHEPQAASAPLSETPQTAQTTVTSAPEQVQESQEASVPLPEGIQAPPLMSTAKPVEAQEPQVAPVPVPEEVQTVEEIQAPATAEVREPQAPMTSVPEVVQEPNAEPAPVTEEATEPQIASVAPSHVKEEAQAILTTMMPNTEIVSIDVRFDQVSEIDQRPVGLLQVEVEETLGHYAEWAGVRTQQIRRLNGLRFGRTLHLHQKIKIPLDKTSAVAFEEQRYEYHKRLQEDFFAVYRVSELEPYRVQPGDNYWTLCREKFGVPMWLLKHYNMDVDLADLHINQKLMIPAIQETAAGDPGTVSNDTASETGPSELSEDDPEPVPAEENPAR
ncbi:MAG: transglycosylase SLT domain-containing protein [Deltaproteobacteria bacterium]|nr:transglycosylase SLT domain-containing protein [Deltaproteobacteria bacterium]